MCDTVVEAGALFLLVALVAVAVYAWFYAAYHAIQMFRHRAPGVSFFELHWPTNAVLTEQGRFHRNRMAVAWVHFGALCVIPLLAAWILGAV